MNKQLHTQAHRARNEIFGKAVIADNQFQLSWMLCNLFEDPIIAVGAPGGGKTLLSRATARVMFGGDAAVVSCFQGAREEDIFYQSRMSLWKGKEKDDYASSVTRRDALLKPFRLFTEWNRLQPKTQEAGLGLFSEGFMVVEGQELKLERGKTIVDMNPYRADFDAWDEATKDRFAACLWVPHLDISQRIQMLARKYQGRHVEDLATEVQPVLTAEQMFEIWDDVKRVDVPAPAMGRITLYSTVFSACIHKLDIVSPAFRDRLSCQDCQFRRHCVTRYLRTPISPRLSESVVRLAKAHAWWEGRAGVDENRDLLPALRLAVGHKAALRDEHAGEYPSAAEWFDRIVVPLLRTRKASWSQAREVMADIEKALEPVSAVRQKQREGTEVTDTDLQRVRKGVAKAGRKLNAFKKDTKDITARCLVDSFCSEPITQLGAEVIEETRQKLDLLLSGQASYTRADLTELERDTSAFPEAAVRGLQDEIAALRYRMKGTVVVDANRYKTLAAKLGELDAALITRLVPASRGTISVGSNGTRYGQLTVQPQGAHVEVSYEAEDSALADVMVVFGAE